MGFYVCSATRTIYRRVNGLQVLTIKWGENHKINTQYFQYMYKYIRCIVTTLIWCGCPENTPDLIMTSVWLIEWCRWGRVPNLTTKWEKVIKTDHDELGFYSCESFGADDNETCRVVSHSEQPRIFSPMSKMPRMYIEQAYVKKSDILFAGHTWSKEKTTLS